jgi:Uma2 family endonuclease
MLLAPRDDFYASAHPQPENVYLLIEVADSTVRIDREVKLPVYAAAGVPEVWIVNLPDHQVEIYRTLNNHQYQTKGVVKGNKAVMVPHFMISITAQDVLGK